MAFRQSQRLTHISTPAAHDITSDPYHRLRGRWILLSPLTEENEEVQGAGHSPQLTAWSGEHADFHLRSSHCAVWRNVLSTEVAGTRL